MSNELGVQVANVTVLSQEKAKDPTYVNRKGGGTMLNGPGFHRTASVSYVVEHELSVERGEEKVTDITNYLHAGVSISDCSRSISLNFDVYEFQDGQNELEKIRKLIQTLQAFEEDFTTALAKRDLAQAKMIEEFNYNPVKPIKDLDEYFKAIKKSHNEKEA